MNKSQLRTMLPALNDWLPEEDMPLFATDVNNMLGAAGFEARLMAAKAHGKHSLYIVPKETHEQLSG